MGLLRYKITFAHPAPSAEAIAEAASKLSGLKVYVTNLSKNTDQGYSANLYFEGFPQHCLPVYTRLQDPSEKIEGDELQSIYIEDLMEFEGTLFDVLVCAAQGLEGCHEEVDKFHDDEVKNLTFEILTDRQKQFRKAQKKGRLMDIAYVLFLIVSSPIWILRVLIKMLRALGKKGLILKS